MLEDWSKLIDYNHMRHKNLENEKCDKFLLMQGLTEINEILQTNLKGRKSLNFKELKEVEFRLTCTYYSLLKHSQKDAHIPKAFTSTCPLI
jgi:hypothetical protein